LDTPKSNVSLKPFASRNPLAKSTIYLDFHPK
jgi:hypothetical protein